MATQGDLDNTAMSKINSVVDALNPANEVRKHQPDGVMSLLQRKVHRTLLWQENWCYLFVGYLYKLS